MPISITLLQAWYYAVPVHPDSRISQFTVESDPIPIHMPPLWPVVCPTDFTKMMKPIVGFLRKREGTSHHLHRQHSDNGTKSSPSLSTPSDSRCFGTSKFFAGLHKVSHQPNTGDRLFRLVLSHKRRFSRSKERPTSSSHQSIQLPTKYPTSLVCWVPVFQQYYLLPYIINIYRGWRYRLLQLVDTAWQFCWPQKPAESWIGR